MYGFPLLTQAADVANDELKETIKEANKVLNTLEGYIPKIIEFLISVLIAIVIFLVGKVVIKYILRICNKFFERTKMEITIRRFLDSLIKVICYIVLVVILCSVVGIDTTSFVAVLGTLGVTVGLALQGSLSNFAGGVLILFLKPFVVGDYIIYEAAGVEGTVQRIDIFYTKLTTIDNKVILLPNGNLSNSTITNVTACNKRKLDMEFGISYDSDIDRSKEIIKQLADKDARIIKDDEIMIFVKELAASQVTIGFRAWVKTEDYWPVVFDMNENVKKTFDTENIEIPYNQLQVHIADKKQSESV